METSESWRSRLSEGIGQADAMTVDLSGATQFDTLGLQLLCAARRSADQRGIEFSIAGSTGAFEQACAAVGLDPAFAAQAGDNHP